MTKQLLLVCGVVLLLLLAPLAEAQERGSGSSNGDKPTTQQRGRFGFQRPSDDELGPQRGDRERGPGSGGYGQGFGPGGGMRRRGWIDPAEWTQAEAFMKDNSPRRWAAFEKIPGDNPHRLTVMRAFYGRYRMLQSLRDEDPALYDLRMKRLKLEDNVFGLVWDLKHEDAPDAKQKIQTDLKAEVVELVDVGIQERGRRIERLETALKDEKERFAKDQNNREGLVKEQLERILKDDNGDPMRPPSPGEQSRGDEEMQSAECRMQNEIQNEVEFFTLHSAL
jgi:hypothetical protein